MKQNTTALTDLIGAIYDAAGDATLWNCLLEKLATASSARSAGLIMHHLGPEMHTVFAEWQVDPEAARLYQAYYGSLDTWALRGHSKPAGYVCTSQERCRPDELRTTEFYCDFLRRFSVAHGLFGSVENSATRWASLSLFRDASQEAFDASDLEIIQLLVPHIQRAFTLHLRLSHLQARSASFEAALSQFSTGVIFIAHDGQILLMNACAETLIQGKDGLRAVNGRIRATIHEESKLLEAMIARAVQTSHGQGMSPGGAMFVSRTSARSLSITIAPMRNVTVGLGQHPAVVLFAVDPERTIEPPRKLLRSCYRLTEAEAQLAMVLVGGCSLKEAAEMCCVTHNTAKTQLKRIFEKTGVNRQGELVRLLLTSSASLQLSHGGLHSA